MAAHRIVAKRLSHGGYAHEHITHVQYEGYNDTKEHVIALINAKTDTFYVQDFWGNSVTVGVVNPAYPHAPYLRTHADGKYTDNLLALPDC